MWFSIKNMHQNIHPNHIQIINTLAKTNTYFK